MRYVDREMSAGSISAGIHFFHLQKNYVGFRWTVRLAAPSKAMT
jgi:hypothetical protein